MKKQAPTGTRRNAVVKLHLTPAEKATVKRLAGEQSESAWLFTIVAPHLAAAEQQQQPDPNQPPLFATE